MTTESVSEVSPLPEVTPLRKKSIRFKLISSFFMMVFSIILLFITLFYISEYKNIRNEIIKHGIEVSDIFTQLTTPLFFSMDYIAILGNCKKLVASNTDIVSVSLLDLNGKQLVGTHNNIKTADLFDTFYKNVIRKEESAFREIAVNHKTHIEFTDPIIIFDKVKALVSIKISLEEMKKRIIQRTFNTFMISMILIVFALILAMLLSRLFIPLKELIEGTKEISKGNLEFKIQEHYNDEIGDLARSFNFMRINLKKNFIDLEEKNREIHELNDKLEMRVRKRTYQLTESNMQLTQEISERKKAENEANELRNYLGSIVNSMPSVIAGINREGRITQWNREAEKLSGISAHEARNRKFNDVFPDMPINLDIITNALTDRNTQKLSTIETVINYEKYYFDITVYPLLKHHSDGVVIKIDDVTDKKEIEKVIIQTEKMISVGGLAAGMAHEINNPLAGIIQNTQVLNNRMVKELPANLKSAEEIGIPFDSIKMYMKLRDIDPIIQNILTMGHRAAKIVDNMLSFSRKSETLKKPESINNLINVSIELAENDYNLKKKYDFKSIRIIKEYDTKLPDIYCINSEIQQVILNILKNGAQAMSMESKKDIRSEPPLFIIRTSREENTLQIEIEDNGLGIPEKINKRIFEPFFTTKDPNMGSGLGLSVSYFIITEKHHGSLTAKSVKGKGSVFTIRLPFSQNS